MLRCWRLKRGLHGLQQDLNFRGADGRWHGIHTYILIYLHSGILQISELQERVESLKPLGSPWCYSWCDHFDVRAKHHRWALRCQSWHKDIYTQMSCKPIEHIFLEICAGLVCAANHVGTLHHAQVWAEGSEEHDHEPVSRMWSTRERSAQTLGLLSSCYSWWQSQVSILGWNQSFLLSHLSGLASRLDLSPFPSGHSPKS